MAREDPTFKLRITPDLKRKVYESAKENRRSMNAEINSRLESSFVAKDFPQPAVVLREIIDRASELLLAFEEGDWPER
jgi:hypothetical protein